MPKSTVMKGCSFLFLWLMATGLLAQSVLIIDLETGAPVERVMVFDIKNRDSRMSGLDGKVDLSSFALSDTLVFQHPSFELLKMATDGMEMQGLKVYLRRRIIHLSEFVVSATHWEQDRKEVPARIMRLDPQEIRLSQPQTMADALGHTGEVFIQKSQMGGGSPMIRGFSANALLIVVDGVRMNNAIFRSGNLQNVVLLDPNIIEQAEVIYGPGSVIYGSDALGGVMDFHTRKPQHSFDSNLVINGLNLIRYGTAAQEFTDHFHINIGARKWAFLSSATYSAFGDLQSGSRHLAAYPDFGKRSQYVARLNGHDTVLSNPDVESQKPSGYKQLNIMQKIRHSPNNTLDLTYAFHLSTSTNIPRYDRLTEWNGDQPKYADWYYGPQRWNLNQLMIHSRANTKLWNQVRMGIARQEITESRHDRRFKADALFHRIEKVVAWNYNLDAEKQIGKNIQLFYGLEGFWNDVKSQGEEENIVSSASKAASTRYPDGKNQYYSAAAYIQSTYKLSKKLISQAGLRYTTTGLESEIEDNSFFHLPFTEISMRNEAVTGSLGLVYHLHKNLQVNLMAGSGFRAPNLDDAAKVFDSEPGFLIVPNDRLDPEYVYNLEGGAIFRFDEKIRLEALVYHAWVEDVMVRRNFDFGGKDSLIYDGTMSRIQALVNGGSARIMGFSVIAYIRLKHGISIQQQWHTSKGWEHPEGIPLRHIPPNYGKTSLTWDHKNLTLNLYADYNGWKDLQDFAPSELNKPHIYTQDGSPAWWTLNIKTSGQLTKGLSFAFGIENILDLHYRPYSSGISAAGRNFIVSLTGKF